MEKSDLSDRNTPEAHSGSDVRLSRRVIPFIRDKVLPVASTLSSVCMVILTLYIARANYRASSIGGRNFELEKYKQTIRLCEEFGKLYHFYEQADSSLIAFKLWEGALSEIDLLNCRKAGIDVKSIEKKWNGCRNDEQRFLMLQENNTFRRILGYFEDAKMLHKKGLLDRAYFDNFFSTLFLRLENAHPSIGEYIKRASDRSGRSDIWDGYQHCRAHVLSQLLIIPDSLDGFRVKKITTKVNMRVRCGQTLMIVSDGSRERALHAERSGYVSEICTERGSTVRRNTIVMKIADNLPWTPARVNCRPLVRSGSLFHRGTHPLSKPPGGGQSRAALRLSACVTAGALRIVAGSGAANALDRGWAVRVPAHGGSAGNPFTKESR